MSVAGILRRPTARDDSPREFSRSAQDDKGYKFATKASIAVEEPSFSPALMPDRQLEL